MAEHTGGVAVLPNSDGQQRSLLLLSNGHGEDVIAVAILQALRDLATQRGIALPPVCALPLVGRGDAYTRDGTEVVGPIRLLPSGGFARQSLTNLLMDLREGLASLLARQAVTLRRLSSSVCLAVCVGDVLPLILSGWFLRRPAILVATAKSDYYCRGKAHHLAVETLLMRRFARRVYARDELTGASLRKAGVTALCVGNAMMDCLGRTTEAIVPPPGRTAIGVLPGSREEAYANMAQILAAARLLGRQDGGTRKYSLLVAAAPMLDAARLAGALVAGGFLPQPVSAGAGQAAAGQAADSSILLAATSPEDVEARVYVGRFGDVVDASDIVIGLAGTGNEQAVGMGKPVVSFAGLGSQFTARFALEQTRLLGEAVSLVSASPEAICAEVKSILTDPVRAARMARVGAERMGPPGAAAGMAEGVLDELGRIT